MDDGVEYWEECGDWVGGGEESEWLTESAVMADCLAQVVCGFWYDAENFVSRNGEESEQECELSCVYFA